MTGELIFGVFEKNVGFADSRESNEDHFEHIVELIFCLSHSDWIIYLVNRIFH